MSDDQTCGIFDVSSEGITKPFCCDNKLKMATANALVHHMGETQTAVMHIADFVYRNSYPLFARGLRCGGSLDLQHHYLELLTSHASPFGLLLSYFFRHAGFPRKQQELTKSDNTVISLLASQDGHRHRNRHRRDATH